MENENEPLCLYCRLAPADYQLHPCLHWAYCFRCFMKYEQPPKCPVCGESAQFWKKRAPGEEKKEPSKYIDTYDDTPKCQACNYYKATQQCAKGHWSWCSLCVSTKMTVAFTCPECKALDKPVEIPEICAKCHYQRATLRCAQGLHWSWCAFCNATHGNSLVCPQCEPTKDAYYTPEYPLCTDCRLAPAAYESHPCQHWAYCRRCFDKNETRVCPECREPVAVFKQTTAASSVAEQLFQSSEKDMATLIKETLQRDLLDLGIKPRHPEGRGTECAWCFVNDAESQAMPCEHVAFCGPCLRRYQETPLAQCCPLYECLAAVTEFQVWQM